MKQALKLGIYGLLYWSGFWLLARRLTRSGTRILMYHGVVLQDIAVWTQLPLDRFQAQMNHLARWYHPVRLSEFVDTKKSRGIDTNWSTVVTFDDGLRNNLTVAYPVLVQYHVPATIYVAISLIDRTEQYGGMIWTDYLRGLLRSTRASKLDLTALGLSEYTLSTAETRYQAELKLAGDLKRLDTVDRESAIGEIVRQLGSAVEREYTETFDGLTWDEIRKLDRTGLVEFGAHTVSHAILSKISDRDAEEEMAQSQSRLEQELHHPVRHFAYPNGTRADFGAQHVEMAARYFDSAVTTVEGLVRDGDGLYDLKRVNVGNDMSMLEFKLRLSGALDLLGI